MKTIMYGVRGVLLLTFLVLNTSCKLQTKQDDGPQKTPPSLNSKGESKGEAIYTFKDAPVPIERGESIAFKLPNGETHWYEVVYLPEMGINWVQAKSLAELAGGYLVTIHSDLENEFVFNLIKDKKYWYQWDDSHNGVMSGPFIGAFQPLGAKEPDGGWQWVSGEEWTYTNWCKDGVKEDRDPRPNDQPNDATGNQNVGAFGEVNEPVGYWGDFPQRFGSFNDSHPGGVYAFIIEYNTKKTQ